VSCAQLPSLLFPIQVKLTTLAGWLASQMFPGWIYVGGRELSGASL
jgi:hypothetical protein